MLSNGKKVTSNKKFTDLHLGLLILYLTIYGDIKLYFLSQFMLILIFSPLTIPCLLPIDIVVSMLQFHTCPFFLPEWITVYLGA